MFTELLPVLQDTMVTVTISRMDDQLLRVNIIPTRKTNKESTAENALCTPLTVTATAAELDQDLGRQVVSFSHSYQRSAANIREIEEAHAAAVKAAEEERKNEKARKSSVPAAKTSPRSDNDSKASPAGKPVFGSKGSGPASAAQSLFDTPAGEAKAAKNESTGVATVVEQSEPESGASATDGEPTVQKKSALTSPVPIAPVVVETGSSSQPVEEICDICKYPISSTQERHPLLPVPAHASAMDCENARRQVSNR
jgi:PRTRC genetic system protein E